MVEKPNEQSKVEAKYPAILFKQHLTAYVEKIYGMIRDSLKKEISPFLNLCIQVNNMFMKNFQCATWNCILADSGIVWRT